jgi:preprotein translocase subunit SecA
VLAGLALAEGKIAEMATGEGKTLAAVAPVFLQALGGRGAHVLTFNDYLARRDAAWMGPAYQRLGLTVGFVQERMTLADRQRPTAPSARW